MQALIVALVVAACAVYATWTLMPAALRRTLARQLRGWPLLGRLKAVQRAAGPADTGCGCSGCDAAPSPDAPKPVQIVRRLR